MRPDESHPERGQFVRDQVRALTALSGVDVQLHEFAPGLRQLSAAARDLRRIHRGERFDVVHAHFGLTAWPALAVPARVHALTVHGTDIEHPRTRLLTAAILRRMDLVAAVSPALIERLPTRSARRRAVVLPCGVDTERFRPTDRLLARRQLGLDPDGRYLLFAADPRRPEKRYDRALAVTAGAQLLMLGGVEPTAVSLWINACDAVLVPSEREGFGLAVLEAMACEVPVIATPVGVHAEALRDIPGSVCAPFEQSSWRAAVDEVLRRPNWRPSGSRERAQQYSTRRMAERVVDAWRAQLSAYG